jgi:mannose-6-phosphate isomerase-like protein (cupin superfamily)
MSGTSEPTEIRPWGSFFVLEEGDGFKVKRIVVDPGGRLSLQSHRHRAEHWTIIGGDATVTVDAMVVTLKRGASIDIAQGSRHRLENFGTEPVVVIEVQFGDYLGEDDIVRYEDVYDRIGGEASSAGVRTARA